MWGMIIVLGVNIVLLMFYIASLNDKVDKLQAEVNKQNHIIDSNQFDIEQLSQRCFDRRI